MDYSIKEVTQLVGLPASTLRYYENLGLIPSIMRDKNGNRVYEEKDVSWLKLILCLRKTDIALSDLREIVDLSQQGDQTLAIRKQMLEEHKERMIDKQKELDEAFQKIQEKIDYYDALDQTYQSNRS